MIGFQGSCVLKETSVLKAFLLYGPIPQKIQTQQKDDKHDKKEEIIYVMFKD
jgi:hypothetical protein